MKLLHFIVLFVVLFLFSCLPKKPPIAGTEVPAGPLVRTLEQQRLAFTGLTALARVQVVREGRKRSFDSVGIVLDAQRRLRVEIFGPLGQSVTVLVWDGKDVFLRLPDDDRIVRPGQAGIERVLGMNMEAKELCAVLSGTITEITRPGDAREYCMPDRVCVVELPEGDVVRRVRVAPAVSGQAETVGVAALEFYRSDKLAYRVRYERREPASSVPLPRTIILERPEKNVVLTIEYVDVDVNVPVAEDAFTVLYKEAGAEVK